MRLAIFWLYLIVATTFLLWRTPAHAECEYGEIIHLKGEVIPSSSWYFDYPHRRYWDLDVRLNLETGQPSKAYIFREPPSAQIFGLGETFWKELP